MRPVPVAACDGAYVGRFGLRRCRSCGPADANENASRGCANNRHLDVQCDTIRVGSVTQRVNDG